MEPMDMFERYFQAIRRYLPSQRQDDIIAELRANLDAQREEREAELGRPLTEGEMIDWLKELGPPMRMASRYQPPRYLIGPALFPVYWHVLRIVFIWTTVAYAIATVVRTLTEQHGPEWIAEAVLRYPGALFVAATWVTIVFAIVEFVSWRYPEKCPQILATSPHWSPSSLPPLEKEPALGGKPRTLTTAIANFVAGFAVLIWLLLIPRYPFLILGPGAAFLHGSPLQIAPVMVWFYWAVVGLHVCQLVLQGHNLLAGEWRITPLWQRFASKALGLIPIAILIGAPGQVYVTRSAAGMLPGGIDVQVATVNHYIFVSFVVVAFIVVIDFAADLWKANRAAHRRQFQAVL